MKPELRAAICRITIPPDDPQGKSVSRGTGFLVAPGFVLTALHVVARRKANPPEPIGKVIHLEFPGHPKKPAVIVVNAWDGEDDWVLLSCPDAPPVKPLALARPHESTTDWITFGYPDDNPHGMVHAGRVRDFNGGHGSTPAFQLFSDEAAAGRGGRPSGLSGAPIIVGRQVIGVMRFALTDEDKMSRAGTLYCCPVERAVLRCPTLLQLQPPETPPGSDSAENSVLSQPLVSASPYRGLKRFNEKDRDLFFGRDQLIAKLLTQLESSNLLLVLGASGSGKSSVVRAGLLPRWRDGDRNRRISFTFEPDKNPFQSFRSALQAGDIKADQIGDRLDGQSEGPASLLQSLRQPGEQWILFVDQFEEVFTLCDERLRQPFLEALLAIARDQTGATKLVLAMRGDFMDRFSSFPEFAKLAEKNISFVANLQPDELRHAIEQPAARHGVVFETGLVEEIGKDVQGQAGSLPLLQYTLDLLWQEEAKRDGLADRHLNTAAYRQLGGVRGALQERAEQIYAGFADGTDAKSESPRQRIVRQIFLRLVSISGENASSAGSRPVRCRAPISDFTGGPNEVVLRELIEKKLLVSSGKQGETAVVEVAHEALFAAWERLGGWINDSRQAIFAKDRLVPDAQRWHELHLRNAELAEAELLGGTRLEQALEMRDRGDFDAMLGGLPQTTVQFLEASVAHRDQVKRRERNRRKRLQVLLGVSVASAAVAVVMAYLSSKNAAKATALLREASISDSATGQALIADGKWQEAVAYFGRALHYDSGNSNASTALWLTLSYAPREAVLPVQYFPQQGAGIIPTVSPDGRRVVTASESKIIRIRDAATGEQVGDPLKHDAEITSANFSPDGTRVITISSDATARIWDATTGHKIGASLKHDRDFTSASISPNGALVVTISSDKTAQIWNVATSPPSAIGLNYSGVTSASFSPDGTRVVTTSGDNTAQIWDADTGQQINHDRPVIRWIYVNERVLTLSRDWKELLKDPELERVVTASRAWKDGNDSSARFKEVTLERMVINVDPTWSTFGATVTGHQFTIVDERPTIDAVSSASFSRDGRRVVTASGDLTARIWDAATGRQIGGPLKHGDHVTSASISPDGEYVLTTSKDKTAKIWNVATGEQIDDPLKHGDVVHTASISPDGRWVVTASWDRTAQIWDAATRQPIGAPMRHDAEVLSAKFSPDGTRVVTGSYDKTARTWDAATGRPLGDPMKHDANVTSVSFSPDGTRVATASADKTVRIWEAATGRLIDIPLKNDAEVTSASLSPDGTRVVTGSYDKTAQIWDATTGQPIGDPIKQDADVNRASFSRDGTRVVTANDDKTARIWDAVTRQPIGRPLKHDAEVLSANFSSDGKRVVTGSYDKTAQIWDAATGQRIGNSIKHDAEVTSANFSPDGKRVVTGSKDKTVRIWDATTGLPLGPPLKHDAGVWSANFSPDGMRVFTASDDNTAQIWDAATAKRSNVSLKHYAGGWSISFSPDGTRVVTGGHDQTVRIWDAATGQLIGVPLKHDDAVTDVSFSLDGTRLFTVSRNRTVRIWDVTARQTMDRATVEDFVKFCAGATFDRKSGTRDAVALAERLNLWAKLEPTLRLRFPDWHFLARTFLPRSPASLVSPQSTLTVREAATHLVLAEWEGNIQQAQRLDPGHPLIQIALASSNENTGQADFLRQYGVGRLPADASMCRLAAGMLLAQGDKARATAVLEKAVKLDPDSPELSDLKKRLKDLK